MSKRDNLLAIDYVKSASTGGASRVVSSGGGSIDTSGFLLLDGTRAMTGSFDVGGNNITNVNLVDGIDIAAHAANPNAHHARQHSYDSTSDHTGTLSWVNVNKAGSNLTDIVTRTHNSLQSIGENDHHNRQHSITSTSDHTVTGSNFDLVGLTGTNTLGILTPSSNVSSGIERILKSNSSGNLNLASLTTTLINSGGGATLEVAPGNYLVLNPAGYLIQLTSGRALQSDNYSSQTTGMRIDHLGGGDFRYLYTDEMHARTFIADLEQALAGGQIISKSVAILNEDFIAPPDTGTIGGRTTTLTVEDLPGTTAMAVFQNGDIVRLRNFSRAGGSLTIADCWGTVTLDTTYGTSGFSNGTQRYKFVRSNSPNGGTMLSGETVAATTLVLDYGTSGNGYYEVNAIDGAYAVNSPYAQVVTWTSHPASGRVTRARLGNLVGIFGGTNEYGLYAGDGGTATSSQYLRISNSGVGLFNVPLRMYTGATETVHIGGWNDVWLGPNSSDRRINWDGSTLTINAVVSIQAGSAGYGNLSGIPTSLANINSTEGAKLGTIATGATKNTVYRQSTQPAISNGDLWYNTSTNVWYQCVSGVWQIAGNYITDTTQLADGAGLGTWASGTQGRPARFSFETTPTGQPAQLYLAANAMGYWDGLNWRTYFDNSGNMVLRGGSGAYVTWNGTTLFGGTSTSTANANWYVDSVNGAFVAGQGQIYITSSAINLTWDGTYDFGIGPIVYGNASRFNWYLGASTQTTLLATMSITEAPLAYAATTNPAARELALRLQSSTTPFVGLYLSGTSATYIMTSLGIDYYGSGFYHNVSSSGIQLRTSVGGSPTGHLYIGGGNFGTSSFAYSGAVTCTNWFRSIGNTGWFNETYAGGIYMEDSTWVRVYNGKWFHTPGVISGGVILAGTSTSGAYQLDVAGEAHVTGSIRADVALSLKATTPPATSAVYAVVFVDSADGDLKVKFTNGVTRTIAVN